MAGDEQRAEGVRSRVSWARAALTGDEQPAVLRLGRRHPLWALAAAAVVVALLLWWLVPGGEGKPSGQVAFATGVKNGVYESYSRLLRSRMARDLPDVQVTLEGSQGGVDNIKRLLDGKADFAIATADAVATYPGADKGRLRACARLYDDYMQLIAPKDAPIGSVDDLEGKRVGVGEDGSGVQLIARSLVRAAGLDFERDIHPVRQRLDVMQSRLRSGELDAFFWSGGLPTGAVKQLAKAMPVKLVQLGDLTAPLHREDKAANRYYRAAVMPPDAYPKVQRGKAVRTLAVANLLLTTDRADSSLTEALTRTLINNRDRIGRQVHAAQNVDLRTAVFTDPVRLHPGAERYYRDEKP